MCNASKLKEKGDRWQAKGDARQNVREYGGRVKVEIICTIRPNIGDQEYQKGTWIQRETQGFSDDEERWLDT